VISEPGSETQGGDSTIEVRFEEMPWDFSKRS
jgi:hypothetical protein